MIDFEMQHICEINIKGTGVGVAPLAFENKNYSVKLSYFNTVLLWTIVYSCENTK